MKTRSIVAATVLAITLAPGLGAAAEIKVISSVGVKTVLEELAPQFERASEHKVKITFGTAVPLKRQIDAGEAFQGAPKPDIGSTDAFKKTVLAARMIAYSKEGQSGAVMARLMERLGIAEEMKAKTILETRSGGVALNVVEGKADLAFNLISEILPIAGAELAGPLPAELQSYVVFAAGIGATTKETEAAKAFINFLKAPAAVPVLKAKGMEPG